MAATRIVSPVASTPVDAALAGETHALRDRIVAALAEARARTLLLVEPLSDEDLSAQHDPLMSPILWDLGHIAHFEELWLVRNLEGPVEFGEMPGMYNPFEHPRRTRGALDLPTRAGTLKGMSDVRERVLEHLMKVDFDESNPLLRDGYVYAMVLQHEYQHNETILQTLQLKRGEPYAAPRSLATDDGRWTTGEGPTRGSATVVRRPSSVVRFPGGPVTVGTDDRSVAYDNERPAHEIELPPFTIDTMPVSNRHYLAFMDAGGYTRREWWSDAGWAWLQESGVTAPKHWFRDGTAWRTREMDRVFDVDPDSPVCHVCYHEAEAFARFAGKRLPTEIEWEVAAGWDPATARMQPFPWGDEAADSSRANVDQLRFGVAPIGSYAGNRSPLGCYGMIGDVWEWTSSDFRPYPGYVTFPYAEYSEVFFGNEYKVLRGGSWATRPGAIRNSFRNWDYPIRRQIFSGFRCARDD
jgi:iron(II)-dependent oxidoreductase